MRLSSSDINNMVRKYANLHPPPPTKKKKNENLL